MSKPSSFDYAIVRVVPRVEREEFINVGVILFCRTQRFLAAQINFQPTRLLALDTTCNVETIQQHLDLIPFICQGGGPIGQLELAERFHWLVAPRSTIIQTSPVHCGLCSDPAQALSHICNTMVD